MSEREGLDTFLENLELHRGSPRSGSRGRGALFLPVRGLAVLLPVSGSSVGTGTEGRATGQFSYQADSWPVVGLVAAHPPATAETAREKQRLGRETPGCLRPRQGRGDRNVRAVAADVTHACLH